MWYYDSLFSSCGFLTFFTFTRSFLLVYSWLELSCGMFVDPSEFLCTCLLLLKKLDRQLKVTPRKIHLVHHLLKEITLIRRSYLSPSDIMRTQPHLLIIGTGFAFGFLVVWHSANTFIKTSCWFVFWCCCSLIHFSCLKLICHLAWYSGHCHDCCNSALVLTPYPRFIRLVCQW